MPAIKLMNVVTTVNAVANLQFATVGPAGAFLTLYAAGVTVGDTISVTVGGKNVVDLAQPNIEASADVVDVDRDMIIEREPVPPGDILVPVTAATAMGILIILEEPA